MRKIGKGYYKNFWAFIQVKVFRMPSITAPKDFKPEHMDCHSDEEHYTEYDEYMKKFKN